MKAYAVIMAGGKGERFWPLSTSRHPKQVLNLVGPRSMMAMAVGYLEGLVPPERTIVITSKDLVSVTTETVPNLPRENIIGEPVGRDTAAVCALAAGLVGARDPDAVFCMLTADHLIGDLSQFRQTLSDGFRVAASQDVLITIGMRPSFPSTGFGYIEAGERVTLDTKVPFFRARRFVEKPDAEKARQYIHDGRFYWNSGMFIWGVKSLSKALRRHVPDLAAMSVRMSGVAWTPAFESELASAYAGLRRISVDYALMEKADNILMAQGTFPWDDLGSWSSLSAHLAKTADGNAILGSCESMDSRDNIVVSRDRLTALIGVQDLVVVQTDRVTLVCHRDRAQDVKRLVQKLGENPAYRDLL